MDNMGWRAFFKQIDHAARRVLEKDVTSIGQQMIFGSGAHGFHQALAQFTLQEADVPAASSAVRSRVHAARR